MSNQALELLEKEREKNITRYKDFATRCGKPESVVSSYNHLVLTGYLETVESLEKAIDRLKNPDSYVD